MKEKTIKKIKTSALIMGGIFAVLFLFRIIGTNGFLAEVENKTFDLRQKIISKYKVPNKDIVILAIDNSSYEYVISNYGAWPVPRDVWADISKGIEKYNPRAIVYDLLFVQNFKAFGNADKKLANVISSNSNIYVSMNFDNEEPDVRKPIDLPSSLETNITGNVSFLKNSPVINYENVRPIMKDILNGTENKIFGK